MAAKLQMNRVALAGTATMDADLREGKAPYAFFTLMHVESTGEGREERRLLVGVYCPASMRERAAAVKRGDNVLVFGSLRVLGLLEDEEAATRVEIRASHLGVICNG